MPRRHPDHDAATRWARRVARASRSSEELLAVIFTLQRLAEHRAVPAADREAAGKRAAALRRLL